jgi:DNA-binding transcriptional LysR family regulator
MTLGQLRTFLAVAEAGSVRAAAERLVVTQPAVSTALATLQREVGVALVVRQGRGLRLTTAGQVFARSARQALGLLDEAVSTAAGHAHSERGRVRLAAVTTAGERIVPPVLASFRARYPHAEVMLEVGNRQRVWDLLANHEVDLAIGGRPPVGRPFVTLATRPNSLVVVAAAGEADESGEGSGGEQGGDDRDRAGARANTGRRRRMRSVTVEELASATWLLREPGSGTRAATEELFAQLDLSPAVLTVGSNGAIWESVQVGLGITLISRDAVAPQLGAGLLVEWRCGPLPLRRSWHVVARTTGGLDPTARLLLRHLVDDGSAADSHIECFRLTEAGFAE